MHKTLIITTFLGLTCAGSDATLTIEDKTYLDYRIINGTSAGIQIIHKDGVAAIPVGAWPKENQAEIVPFLDQHQLKKKQEIRRGEIKTQMQIVLFDFAQRVSQVSIFCKKLISEIVDFSPLTADNAPKHKDKKEEAQDTSSPVVYRSFRYLDSWSWRPRPSYYPSRPNRPNRPNRPDRAQ